MCSMCSNKIQAEECSKSPHVPEKANNKRIYLDNAIIKAPSNVNVTKTDWHIMMDERTQLKFSDFFPTKNGMVEPNLCQVKEVETSRYASAIHSIRQC